MFSKDMFHLGSPPRRTLTHVGASRTNIAHDDSGANSSKCAKVNSFMDFPMEHWFQSSIRTSGEVQDAGCTEFHPDKVVGRRR